MLVFREDQLVLLIAVVEDQSISRQELGIDDRSPETAAETPEHHIGHPGHGG